MTYFRILNDFSRTSDWFLSEPLSETDVEIDARLFTSGEAYVGPPPARVRITQKGKPIEFTLASFDMPIVSHKVGEILNSICPNEIQRLPVTVESSTSRYEILNIKSTVDCLDESLSRVEKWRPEDGRIDLVGSYRTVVDIRLDPARIDDQNIFRVLGWEIALIVSNRVMQALDGIPDLGTVFKRVSP